MDDKDNMEEIPLNEQVTDIKEDDDQDDYVELSDADLKETKETVAPEETYTSMAADALVGLTKKSFVYSARTVGGCFTAITLVPRALPIVATYFVPSAAIPGVIAQTTTASLGVVGFGLGSQVSSTVAEAAWDISSLALSKTMTYIFDSQAPVAKEKKMELSVQTGLVAKNKAQ